MRSLIRITLDSFLLLRRDKIFIPATIAWIGITILANLMSDWSVADFNKILMDVGAFSFNVMGVIIAIFWSTKSIHDSTSGGAVELDLAGPVSRPTWLVGRFLGLTLSLAFMAVVMLFIWQVTMLLNDFGTLNFSLLAVFFFYWLTWILMAACGFFFSSFSGHATALFSTVGVWLIGMTISLIERTIPPGTDPSITSVVHGVAWGWNLQRFNLMDISIASGYSANFITPSHMLNLLIYGLSLIVIFIGLGGIFFSKRDLAS